MEADIPRLSVSLVKLFSFLRIAATLFILLYVCFPLSLSLLLYLSRLSVNELRRALNCIIENCTPTLRHNIRKSGWEKRGEGEGKVGTKVDHRNGPRVAFSVIERETAKESATLPSLRFFLDCRFSPLLSMPFHPSSFPLPCWAQSIAAHLDQSRKIQKF